MRDAYFAIEYSYDTEVNLNEVAWAEITPAASFAGGAKIALAAMFLMLLNGRVMQVGGFVSGLWSDVQIGQGGVPEPF